MNKDVLDLIETSQKLFISDIEAAGKIAKKAVMLSRAQGMDKELAESLIILSKILSEQGKIKKVNDYLLEALSLLEKSNNKDLILKVHSGLGRFYMSAGEIDDSFTSYMESLRLSNEIGEIKVKASTLLGIGVILTYKDSTIDALEYYKSAMKYAEETCNIEVKLKSLNNLGCAYNSIDRLDEAEEYLTRCISLCRKESVDNVLISSLDELGLIFIKKGQKSKAIGAWKESIEIDQSRGESYKSIAPNINLADIYINSKELDLGRKYLDEAYRLCQNAQSKINLVEVYRLETKICEISGDYKEALDYYKKYIDIDKSINAQESIRNLEKQKVKNLTESKDRIVILGNVGRVITESLDLKTMLSSLYVNIGKLLDFSILGIATYDKGSQRINYELFMEKGKILPNTYTNLDDENSVAAWVIRNDKPIVIGEYQKEFYKYVKNSDGITTVQWTLNDEVPKSILYNPLKIGDNIIGIITVQSYTANAYSSDDIESFNILASYVAIGLNNAKQSEKIIQQNRELSVLATSDSLTGLKNRRAFFEDMNKFWSWAVRTNTSLSLILLDLDLFKRINDTYGHPAGDHCLKEVSNLLKNSVKRSNDQVARLGGEEFGIFLGATDELGANIVAEKIRLGIQGLEMKYDSYEFNITVSMGIRTVTPNGKTHIKIEDIFSDADKALYDAKHSGRNLVKTFGIRR